MNEIEYSQFTEYMATGHSIGRLGWVIPSILFQANIAAAGRVKNEHNLSQYSFEGAIVVRLHLRCALDSGYAAKRRACKYYYLEIGVRRRQL